MPLRTSSIVKQDCGNAVAAFLSRTFDGPGILQSSQSKIMVYDRNYICWVRNRFFRHNQKQERRFVRQIRYSLATDSAHKLLDATQKAKALSQYQHFQTIFDHFHKTYSQLIIISDPNIIIQFCSYFMVFQGNAERTTWIKKMTTKCCLLVNVPVPVLLSYLCK